MPAVTIRTSAPERSSQLAVPVTRPSAPESVLDCSRSSALPFAKLSFAGMSKSTTSPSCFASTRFASSPPMLPAPIRPIFFLAMGRLPTPKRGRREVPQKPPLPRAELSLRPELGVSHEWVLEQLAERERPGDQVTLNQANPGVDHGIQRAFRLDALGHDQSADVAAEVRDAPQDRVSVGVVL